VGFWGVGFLGGCTPKKNQPGFFKYVPGCLNPDGCTVPDKWTSCRPVWYFQLAKVIHIHLFIPVNRSRRVATVYAFQTFVKFTRTDDRTTKTPPWMSAQCQSDTRLTDTDAPLNATPPPLPPQACFVLVYVQICSA